ncbi:MAG: type I-E CRISPR-associated protein Cas6/Cse3/CasE [Thermodesulfobacteriota bacterium]
MYFSTIRLRRGITPREIAKLTGMGGYQVHQLIWKLFADHPDRRRDFIYRYEPVGGWPSFYTVSSREPLDDMGLWEIRTKEYNPCLRPGQRLGFSLRANPIRTRHDANGKQQRHDVVMEEKIKAKNTEKEIDLPEIVQEQGYLWLEKRSTSQGFHVSATGVRVGGYRQHKFYKGKGNTPVTFSTLDFDGILTVSDPDVFVRESLFGGIGPAKSFGCGLILARRL